MQIKERRISRKTVKYIRDPKTGKTIHLDIPEDEQKVVCVSDEEIMKLAELAKRIEKHYGKPMDIEWAIDQDLSYPREHDDSSSSSRNSFRYKNNGST